MRVKETENVKQVLLVSHPKDESYDMPGVFGPFDTPAQAVDFAEDFREANNLPREATPENNEVWTEAGWYFGIHPVSSKVEKWA